MADLDNLNYKSILYMDNDEAIETLRQIRLSRREVQKSKARTPTAKKPQPKISEAQAAELLRILGGKS